MTTRRRKRHTPEQIVRKLRDADAMLNSGKDEAAVLQALEISESTYERWRRQYGGMKAEEAKRLKELEDENRRLKQIVADQVLDIQMLKHISEGNCRTSSMFAFAHGPFPKAFSRRASAERVCRVRAASVLRIGSAAEYSALRVGASG